MAHTDEGKNWSIVAGMFCYGPNDFSFDLRNDQVKGIVLLVHGGMVYCDFFEEKEKPSKEVSAYVKTLHYEGFESACVWVPSAYEMQLILTHYAEVNEALERIHRPILSGTYLSSSDSFEGHKWVVSFPDGGRKSSERSFAYKVRPVLRFSVPD